MRPGEAEPPGVEATGLDPGRPPLKLKRFFVRLGLLIGVVWGSPIIVVVMLQLAQVGYGVLSIGVCAAFAVLCHVMGRLVGRFERDTPVQYGVGCSWPFWLFGGLGFLGGWLWWLVPLLVAGAGVFIAGWTGARRSVGRRARLIAEGRCVFCEYDLAGLGATGVCPECGQKFERAGAM